MALAFLLDRLALTGVTLFDAQFLTPHLQSLGGVEISRAMYMKLLMRLQKKEISAETEDAFDAMRVMLAYLSKAYAQMKAGDMDFLNN